MTKKIYSTIILFVLCKFVVAQGGFQRLIGGSLHERAQTVFNTYDLKYMVNAVTGSYGAGSIDAMLVKLDSAGQILWSKTYGTSNYDNSEFAIETFDHNYLCIGRTELTSGNPTAALMFKTDSAGNMIWSKTYGGNSNDGFIHVIETANHGYAVTGNTASLTSGGNDILFVRTDANGDTLFTRSYGTTENESGAYILELPDHGFVICGRQTTNFGTEGSGCLLKVDSMGNLLWTKMYGDTLFTELTAVRPAADGGLIAVGSSTGYGNGGFDIMLMKTDSAGNVQWTKTYGGTGSDAGYDIHISPDGYIISGFTESLGYGHRQSTADEANIFLLETDTAGAVLWMDAYGDGLQDEAYRSDIDLNGGYIIGGYTSNYLLNDSSQMLVIKTDHWGATGCHEEIVVPVDSNYSIIAHDSVFIQQSGFQTGNVTLISNIVTPNNDDACLFLSAHNNITDYENHIYPNPFSEKLFVKITNAKSDVTLFDSMGKIIFYQDQVTDQIEFNTSSLPGGYYFLRIMNAEKTVTLPVVHLQ